MICPACNQELDEVWATVESQVAVYHNGEADFGTITTDMCRPDLTRVQCGACDHKASFDDFFCGENDDEDDQ
ncbi:MAG: hypothetical protein HQL72_02175 [Magnetococcales bacterium]|nr:hypothetical protein [Magnetococcales bacterium]